MSVPSSVSRRAVIVGAGLLVSGCMDDDSGTETDGTEAADDSQPTEEQGESGLRLASPAFADGEQIPEKYGYNAENVNPPLEIAGVPEDAESLALIVDDPDAVEPAGKVWDHWIVWNIPPETATIPEGWEPSDAEEGTNDFDEVGYGGPSPPDSAHTYRFRLFALETELDLPTETDAEALESTMDGSIVAQTVLEGTYPA